MIRKISIIDRKNNLIENSCINKLPYIIISCKIQNPKWMVVTPIKAAFTLCYPSPRQQWGRPRCAPDRRDWT